MSQVVLRIRKILFFGTEFLCGVDPPVLKLQKFDTFSEYISVVRYTVASQPESTTVSPTEGQVTNTFSIIKLTVIFSI